MKRGFTEKFQVTSPFKTGLIDITARIEEVLKKATVKDGLCVVYVPHTTAAVTINENADPTVSKDMTMALNRIVPLHDRYEHREGNSPAHIKASLIGPSEMVLIESGRLVLGTWQGVFFCEFDGPRSRTVYVRIVKDEG